MMRCKNCGFLISKENLQSRFKAGLAHCPNKDCNNINWDWYEKYGKLISKPTEFEVYNASASGTN